MSFGPSNTTKAAENNLAGGSSLALNDLYPKATGGGTSLINAGTSTAQPGIDYFTQLLAGNRAGTTATLQPNIDAIRQNNAKALTAINTLTPRGGGRSGANYEASFAPTAGISSLFNTGRTAAATTLPSIGLQQSGQGINLFGLGANALNSNNSAAASQAELAQRDRQMSNSLIGGIGSSLMGLALAPVSGGGSLFGSIFGK